MVVAIDGPAGSGKGTIANLLSKKYNLINIDTGATYRCVALKAIRNNCVDDKEKIIEVDNSKSQQNTINQLNQIFENLKVEYDL